MKRILSVAALAALMLVTVASSASAKSWRINNNTTRKAHFVDINAACASADVQDGDTLYLDPGCNLAAAQTVTKQLTIVGTGYFLKTPYAVATISANLSLRAKKCKAEGISVNSINIQADSVTVERCKLSGSICLKHSSYYARYAIIRQCYIYGGYIYGYGATSERSAFCTIENCLIKHQLYAIQSLYSPTIRYNFIESYNNGSGYYTMSEINNGNITDNVITYTNATYYNNIFKNVLNSNIDNNILSCDEGVYTSISANNTCLGTNKRNGLLVISNGLYDHEFEMHEDSPAWEKEVGPFFGPHPYVWSGMPYGYPYYTDVNVAAKAKDGIISVSIKTKIQDE